MLSTGWSYGAANKSFALLSWAKTLLAQLCPSKAKAPPWQYQSAYTQWCSRVLWHELQGWLLQMRGMAQGQ